MVLGRYTAFSNNEKIVPFLHNERERKVEKLKHMKFEVVQPKLKKNLNFRRVNKPYRISTAVKRSARAQYEQI